MNVFLVGEGKDDIGRWAIDEAYRDTSSLGDGVIGGLARKTAPGGWRVSASRVHSRVPALRVGRHEGGEARKLRGAQQLARDAGCEVLVFARDMDNQYTERSRALRAGQHLTADVGTILALVEPCIEGWVLELVGERRTQGWSRKAAQARWSEQAARGTTMARVVESWPGGRERLSAELTAFLEEVETTLGRAR